MCADERPDTPAPVVRDIGWIVVDEMGVQAIPGKINKVSHDEAPAGKPD